MGTYRVLIHGRNFILEVDGKKLRHGFYATRVVEADTPAIAEVLVVELIGQDSQLNSSVVNEKSDPPMLYAQEIEEIRIHDRKQTQGFSFYLEEEQ